MTAVFVEAVGVLGPGLNGWSATRAVLRDEVTYDAAQVPTAQPTLLPANERRRAPPAVRLAFAVAEEAVRATPIGAESLATVFASSDADMSILHRICTALTQPTRSISPTDFHNSVHNAAAGYWSIGAASRLSSSTIAAYDFSFAMGLLEAVAFVAEENVNTLLVTYDVPPPDPLYEHRPIVAPMALALVLTATRTAQSLAQLELRSCDAPATPQDARFASLSAAVPPARALPLLALLARETTGSVVIDCAQRRAVRIDVSQA
jgi:hypothetical protein